jgi:hypothetical protein
MKTKIYKLLSALLALTLVFSVCFCVANAAIDSEQTYQDVVSEASVESVYPVEPALTQGTIDKGVVMTHVETRLHTVELFKITDFQKLTVASGYKVVVHFYDENGTWKANSGWLKGEYNIASLSGITTGCTHFKIVLGATSDANIIFADIPAGTLVLYKKGTPPETPVDPETPEEPGDFSDVYFDDISEQELSKNWNANGSNYQLNNGKLKINGQAKILYKKAIFTNSKISSLDQYVSLEFKGTGITDDITPTSISHRDQVNGVSLFGRLNLSNRQGYEVKVSKNRVILMKRNGVDSSGLPTATVQVSANSQNSDSHIYKSDFDLTGINGWSHYIRMPESFDAGNLINLNDNHSYRLGMSIVDGKNASGETVAYVRIFLIDITLSRVLVDETFMDTNPYSGTNFGFAVNSNTYKTCSAEFDNIWFSVNGFREDDVFEITDVNNDTIFDIRDLVFLNEAANDSDIQLDLDIADKNKDGAITVEDVNIIRKALLVGAVSGNLTSQEDDGAHNLRNEIMSVESGIKNGAYYPDLDKSTNYKVNNVYYVSSSFAANSKGTINNPWGYEDFICKNNDGTVKAGDAVLFKRGDEFVVSMPYEDQSLTSQGNRMTYASFNAKAGVVYGAYGTGEKPIFNGSTKDYASVKWEKVEGKDNIYKTNAPEIAFDKNPGAVNDIGAASMIFNGRIAGSRRFYVKELYTLFKNEQYAYDSENGILYLYSDKGDPSSVYNSIEVSRDTYGITVDNGADNVVIDNLSIYAFGHGGIRALGKNDYLTVSNCNIKYTGGVMQTSNTSDKYGLRFGNAIEAWNKASYLKVINCYISQTYDTAITAQGNGNISSGEKSYNGFTVQNCLLEYNNTDIEFFDSDTTTTTFENVVISDNVFRFTSLGWGTCEADKVRGIQGVLRFVLGNLAKVSVKFTDNIIDNPGMEIFNVKNYNTSYQSTFKFGTSYNSSGDSTIANNKYYCRSSIRNYPYVVTEYNRTGKDDTTHRGGASTATEFKESIKKVDKSSSLECYWNGTLVN